MITLILFILIIQLIVGSLVILFGLSLLLFKLFELLLNYIKGAAALRTMIKHCRYCSQYKNERKKKLKEI